MAQKNSPYVNKTGYSMFWNSMWESKNNFSKNTQKDFFLKSFINFFVSDYLFNNIFYKNFNSKKLNYNYNYNFTINKYFLKIKFKSIYDDNNIIISKIWFFKYQNWFLIFFYVFSKLNSFFFKNELKKTEFNLNFYNKFNNFYFNNFKNNLNFNMLRNFILKNNF